MQSPGLVEAVRAHGNGKGKILCRTKLAELCAAWYCCVSILGAFGHGRGQQSCLTLAGFCGTGQDPAAEFLAAVGTRIMDLMHPHAYPSVNQKPLHWFLWHGASPAPNGAIHKNPITLPGGSVDAALALGGCSQPGGVILWTGGKNQTSGLSFLILSMLPALNHGNNYPASLEFPSQAAWSDPWEKRLQEYRRPKRAAHRFVWARIDSLWDANKGVANFLEKAAGNHLLSTNLPRQVRKKGKLPKQLPVWIVYCTRKLTSLNRVAPLLLFLDTQSKLRLALSPPVLLLLHHILMQCFCSWEKDGWIAVTGYKQEESAAVWLVHS